MSNHQLQHGRPLVARTIHRFSVAIMLAWLAIIGVLSFCVPSLEQVEHEHSVSLSLTDAPSVTALQRVNVDFKQSGQSGQSGSGSGSVAMIVLEGQQHLLDDAHN
jgi:RND superfamily putative drug exporter